jgi:hypothetical protein
MALHSRRVVSIRLHKQKRCLEASYVVRLGEVIEMADLPFSSRFNGGETVSMRLECTFGNDRS